MGVGQQRQRAALHAVGSRPRRAPELDLLGRALGPDPGHDPGRRRRGGRLERYPVRTRRSCPAARPRAAARPAVRAPALACRDGRLPGPARSRRRARRAGHRAGERSAPVGGLHRHRPARRHWRRAGHRPPGRRAPAGAGRGPRWLGCRRHGRHRAGRGPAVHPHPRAGHADRSGHGPGPLVSGAARPRPERRGPARRAGHGAGIDLRRLVDRRPGLPDCCPARDAGRFPGRAVGR